jgi:cobalt-precorrin-7 (C5)-methyltransferase
MKIVGVGCAPGMLTEEAILVIKSAKLILGSERALVLADRFIQNNAEVRVIVDYHELKNLPDDAVVLSTGDPMVSGLGYLEGEIVSGISSVQYGAAKTGISLAGMYICSAHGRDHDKVIQECCEIFSITKKIVIITDPSFSIIKLGKALSEHNIKVTISLCENLGYPDESILSGNIEDLPESIMDPYILFLTDKNT